MKLLPRAIALLSAMGLAFLLALLLGGQAIGKPSLLVQNLPSTPLQLRQVNARAYQELPDLPLENTYIDRGSNDVDPESTLVWRMMNYHLYVKRRPPQFRLDWKLTLADYLGANEAMRANAYPGNNTLTVNPLEGDRAAVATLTVDQRNDLVQLLAILFNPNYQDWVRAQVERERAATASTPPPPEPSNNPVPLPEPGAADLLAP